MKKFLVLILLGLIAFAQLAEAQTNLNPKRYAIGYASAYDMADADTISPLFKASVNVISLPAASNTLIQLNSQSNALPGNMACFIITADSTNRMVTWGSGWNAKNDSVLALKTKVWSFISDGSEYFLMGPPIQVD